MSESLGYPYSYGDLKDDGVVLSDLFFMNKAFLLGVTLSVFSPSAAFASDIVSEAAKSAALDTIHPTTLALCSSGVICQQYLCQLMQKNAEALRAGAEASIKSGNAYIIGGLACGYMVGWCMKTAVQGAYAVKTCV